MRESHLASRSAQHREVRCLVDLPLRREMFVEEIQHLTFPRREGRWQRVQFIAGRDDDSLGVRMHIRHGQRSTSAPKVIRALGGPPRPYARSRSSRSSAAPRPPAHRSASPSTPSPPAPSAHDSSASPVEAEAEYEGRMAHFLAFRALGNGLVEPCARHDSNVRPLPPQGSALSPELRARDRGVYRVSPGALSAGSAAAAAARSAHPGQTTSSLSPASAAWICQPGGGAPASSPCRVTAAPHLQR